MDEPKELRIGKQFLALIIDYFVGVIAYFLLFVIFDGYVDIGLENMQNSFVFILGAIAYMLPSFFLEGATIGVRLVGGAVVRKGTGLPRLLILIRGILYFPIMVLGLYVLILKGLFATKWPFDPVFGVRIIQR